MPDRALGPLEGSRRAEPVRRESSSRAWLLHSVYDLLWAPGATSLADIGETMGLPDNRMWELNPQLIRGLTPPGSVYPLRVPVGQAYRAMAALAAPDRRSRRAD